MNAAWKKAGGDLKSAPARMALVALAVFVGTVAMGTAWGARLILAREVAAGFAATNPPSATLWLDRVDAVALAEAEGHPGFAVEPWRTVRARVEVGPGEWQPLRLFVVRDFASVRVSKFFPAGGDWPPRDGEVLVERSALPVLRAGAGDRIRVRLPGGALADVRVGGVVHDAGQAPGWMDQVAYAYCTPATLRGLSLDDGFNELRLVVDGDRERAAEVAGAFADRLRAQGYHVHRIEVPPREHPHADHMNSMLVVLQVFSVMALVLSGAMAANVVSALVAKQVRQIGVMKAIGATVSQVTVVYLRLVVLLAVGSAACALPVAAWASARVAASLGEHLNLRVTDLTVPWWLWPAEVAVGVGVPVLATAIVVFRTARVPAREAIAGGGITAPAVGGWLSRLWSGASGDRVLALGLRNTFRRPGRLALSLGTFALGGAVVMTAANVYSALVAGLDSTLTAQGHDIDVRLLSSVPAEPLVGRVRAVPGVTGVEAWGTALVNLERPEGQPVGTARYTVLAPPPDTRFLAVPLVAGRWPRPDEADAVVVNRTLADKEPLARFGNQVTLQADGRRHTVRVVGVVEEIAPPTLYTNGATLFALTGPAGAVGALRVTTTPGAERAVAAELESVLADRDAMPVLLMTRAEFRASLLDHFRVVVVCLLAAGFAAVAVGGMTVATGVGIGVLERAREIGVARALGATRRAIRRMLLVEGLTLAGLSVGVGVLLALPASAALTRVVGDIGPHVRLPLVVSPGAVAGWAVVAAAVTLTATLLAARHALAVPARDVLTHE